MRKSGSVVVLAVVGAVIAALGACAPAAEDASEPTTDPAAREPPATVRVLAGDELEVGPADEGDYLALFLRPPEERTWQPVLVGHIPLESYTEPGTMMGATPVPVDTAAIYVHRFTCPEHGCVEEEMRERVGNLGRTPFDRGSTAPRPLHDDCVVEVDLEDGDVLDISYNHASLGPPFCETSSPTR